MAQQMGRNPFKTSLGLRGGQRAFERFYWLVTPRDDMFGHRLGLCLEECMINGVIHGHHRTALTPLKIFWSLKSDQSPFKIATI